MESDTTKEIKGQAQAWEAALSYMQNERQELEKYLLGLNRIELIFIGCGTSYYLSLCAAATYMGVTGELARAVTASDVILYHQSVFPKNGKWLGVPISRSGETTETIWATQHIHKLLKIKSLGLSCTPGSKLVEICERTLLAKEAAEKSVVMTKSFTSMLLLIQMLAAFKAKDKQFENQLLSLPDKGFGIIEQFDKIAREIAEFKGIDKYIFLGQGPYYGLACESMLKMKEMALSFSEAFHSMEFRHGPISNVNSDTLVTILMSESSQEQEIKVIKEVKELGAKTFIICDRCPGSISTIADFKVELNSELSDYSRLILYMPITQLLGNYKALHKGLDPDNPRHLTQVVVLR